MGRRPAASLVFGQLAGRGSHARKLVAAALLSHAVATAATVALLVVLAGSVASVFAEGSDLTGIRWRLVAMAGLVLLRAGAVRAGGGWFARAGELVELDLRRATVRALASPGRLPLPAESTVHGPAASHRTPPGHTGDRNAAAAASTVLDGTDAVGSWVTEYLPAAAGAVFAPALVFVLVLLADPPSALILVFTGPMLVLLLAVIGRRTSELTERREEELAWLRSLYADLLAGISTLRTFGRSREGADLVDSTSSRFANRTLEVLRTAFQTSLVMEWAATAATALVAVEVSFRLTANHIGFASALAVLMVVPEFFAGFRTLALAYHSGASGDAAATSIRAVLDRGAAHRPHAADGDAATRGPESPAPAAGGSTTPPSLELTGIQLRYPGAATPALDGVDLGIAAGETVALCGPSGAGKSTIARVLVGLEQPGSGAVSCDGMIVRTDDDRWRAGVAWVPQAPTLFAGTIRDNIDLGAPGASPARIRRAARVAAVDDFIAPMEHGLETRVGEEGIGLSGGERQRIAIARAVLREAPLVVLDEFTSQLDPATEERVLDALHDQLRDTTVVMVAHREAVARRADRLVVVEDGEVVDQGPPAEVLARRDWDSLLRGDTHGSHGTRYGDAAGRLDRGDTGAAAGPDEGATPGPDHVAVTVGAERATPEELLRSLRDQWRWIAAAVGLAALTTLSGIGLIAVAAWLISRASQLDGTAELGLGITVVRLFAVSRVGLRYAERLVGHIGTFRWLTEQRVRTYRRLEPLLVGGGADLRRGDLLTRVMADIDTLGDLPLRAVVPILAGTASLGVTAALLWWLAPAAAVLAVTALLLAGVAVPWATRRALRGRASDAAEQRGLLEADLVESLQGLDELVVLGRTERITSAVDASATAFGAQERFMGTVRARAQASASLLVGAGVLGSFAMAVLAVRNGALSGVLLATVPLVVIAATETVSPFGPAIVSVEKARAALGRQLALGQRGTRSAAAPPGHEDPCPAPRPTATTAPPAIELSDVSFSHHGAASNDGPAAGDGGRARGRDRARQHAPRTLAGIDMVVPAGCSALLSGPSGVGKSTLVSLLCGLAEADSGTVTLGGRRLCDLLPEEVAEQVAVVRQHDHLFDTSVRDNLALGDPWAGDERMSEVLEAVGAGEWLEGLADGLDTRIGPDGDRLSGGERQRLLVARALLRDVPLLVLDEATSHLDARSEARVLEAVEAWRNQPGERARTVLWVAHHRPRGLEGHLGFRMEPTTPEAHGAAGSPARLRRVDQAAGVRGESP